MIGNARCSIKVLKFEDAMLLVLGDCSDAAKSIICMMYDKVRIQIHRDFVSIISYGPEEAVALSPARRGSHEM